LFILATQTRAEVWKATENWNQEWEAKYQEWIASDAFNKRIFIDQSSPYKNLATDCADIAYAARIIFSYENKIKFKSLNPDKEHVSIFNKYVNSSTGRFDSFPEGPERVKAYITYLGKFSGTDLLSSKDTYPIALKAIKPGDFYIAEKVVKGITIRHTYIIKKVYPSGIFDLYYSTLPYMVRELKYHRGLPLFSFPAAPYGFRRFINSSLIDKEIQTYPDYSTEEYDLLKTTGPENILIEISKKIRVTEEGYQTNINRVLGNICRAINDRTHDVDESVNFVESVQYRCVTKSEFDNYSTPLQDERIYKQISLIHNFWRSIQDLSILKFYDKSTVQGMNYLIGKKPSSAKALTQLCGNYSSNPISIKEFYERYSNGTLSSHPNDIRATRWGMDKSRTNCPMYY
jgi:hypothetical protein